MKCVLNIGGDRWIAPNATLAGRVLDLLSECQPAQDAFIRSVDNGPSFALFKAEAGSFSHQGRIENLEGFALCADRAEAEMLAHVRELESEKAGGAA